MPCVPGRRAAEAMSDGYWVVSVDRRSGRANTSELFTDRDEAWQHSVDIEDADTYTTVVSQRPATPKARR